MTEYGQQNLLLTVKLIFSSKIGIACCAIVLQHMRRRLLFVTLSNSLWLCLLH